MTERNLMILGGLIGAVVGVGVGYALFTERGRQLRADLQPEIEGVIREAVRLTQVVDEFKTGRPSVPTAASAWPRRTV
ncbi:MAG: hypothetical protein CK533_00070 [Acidobacterium sp.]|nr:hypothetical protein [Acidobacteriota bacterium]PHY12129.1 MAG: hypothetical protein CK533_00070 [Acidobacterium sp.]